MKLIFIITMRRSKVSNANCKYDWFDFNYQYKIVEYSDQKILQSVNYASDDISTPKLTFYYDTNPSTETTFSSRLIDIELSSLYSATIVFTFIFSKANSALYKVKEQNLASINTYAQSLGTQNHKL